MENHEELFDKISMEGEHVFCMADGELDKEAGTKTNEDIYVSANTFYILKYSVQQDDDGEWDAGWEFNVTEIDEEVARDIAHGGRTDYIGRSDYFDRIDKIGDYAPNDDVSAVE